ncbi:hypothetical protein SY27_15285 [Flavobacterium sp. 316]|uniref:ATP-binding protein n=1 Tax=Flavobacterium sp. 316 TaxID=1603293 RepID=UPI0005E3D698|nr:ATP-binding protein [Flavobacterium sp. 316]KIX19894.1 hypothetical protein SY27_15285 [Flavobacterium sp. 316]
MDTNIIEGNPTKTFFIEMITRDISIKDAILDLLDNSIDGANRINPSDYSGLFIDITINKDEFIVKDNCGGFTLETAQKYAFRFGRPDDAPASLGSVGRFGIGMKRALFKIGHDFEVESKTKENHFQIDVDVNKWKSKKKKIKFQDDSEKEIEDWDFRYEEINKDTCNLEEEGTYIKVVNLHTEVSSLFDDEEFIGDLKDDIERLLNFSLEKKIKITLNGINLNKKDIVIFNEKSTPYYHEGSKNNVNFKVIAGLGEVGTPSVSGWYIYCNDRLVLEADKSEITGWGTSNISKWHIDFVMFRGIVFLDSEETINLPLTTTKKGIDATSDIYKSVLVFMKESMNNIIPFLREVTKLGNEANEFRKMLGEQENKVSVVEIKKFPEVYESRKFISPVIDSDLIAQKKDTIRIAFDVKKEIADKAKFHSDSKSYKELGEIIFNYYLKMEDLADG